MCRRRCTPIRGQANLALKGFVVLQTGQSLLEPTALERTAVTIEKNVEFHVRDSIETFPPE